MLICYFDVDIPHGQSFYDLHIEDMWLPYFCNTTNIITSRMEIHETGYAWRFIRKMVLTPIKSVCLTRINV